MSTTEYEVRVVEQKGRNSVSASGKVDLSNQVGIGGYMPVPSDASPSDYGYICGGV
jgi:hypothetical protein